MNSQRDLALSVMEVVDRAYLTTLTADGYPETRAILNLRNPSLYPGQAELFAAHRDDLLVYVTTNTSSEKIRQIERSWHGCVYYCHPKEFRGVALVGDLAIVRDSAVRHALWNEGWTIYYPGGVDDPDNAVVSLRPRWVRGWYERGRFEFAIGRA